MNNTISSAALADCVVPLDDEGRRGLRRYWEKVIRDEWVPPERRVRRPMPVPEDNRRERREARRAIARIAAVSRTAQLHASPAAAQRPGFKGEVA